MKTIRNQWPTWVTIYPINMRALVIEKVYTKQHSGNNGMYNSIKINSYWPGMTADICRLIKTCEVCQAAKNSKHPLLAQTKTIRRQSMASGVNRLSWTPHNHTMRKKDGTGNIRPFHQMKGCDRYPWWHRWNRTRDIRPMNICILWSARKDSLGPRGSNRVETDERNISTLMSLENSNHSLPPPGQWHGRKRK